MNAPPSEEATLDRTGVAPLIPDVATLDRALGVAVALAFLVLFLSPTRILFIPFDYGGEYLMYLPPNVLDLMWLGIGVALCARAGLPSGRAALGLAAMLIIGIIGLVVAGDPGPDQITDLLLFNLRVAGGLVLGAMLARTPLGDTTVPLVFLGGSVLVAGSSLVLAMGGATYDFYSELRRFGSLGMAPNETGCVLAGAFNMLPWLTRDRRWLAVASPALVLGVLLTGSRTGLLLMMAGAVFWIPGLVGTLRGFRAVVVWLVILVVGGAAAWLAQGFVGNLMSREVVASLAERTMDTGSDESSMFRLTIYLETLRYLWENPLAFLVGVGGSNVAVEWLLVKVLPLGTWHTHDLFLQAFAAYGVAGLVASALLLRPLLRRGSHLPSLGAKAMRAFGLTVIVGQLIQYGLGQEKFLLFLTIAVGYVAAAGAPRYKAPDSHVSLDATA